MSLPLRKCKFCGGKLKRSGRKFCSFLCFGKWRSKTQLGANNPKWRGGNKKITCEICGKEFFVNKASKARFCSSKCKCVWHSKTFIREKSPNWNGGTTSLRGAIRSSLPYHQWRKKCFMRDNFSCQECGVRGGDLQVHHKKTLFKLLQESKLLSPLLSAYDAAMICSSLWDIKNGITLCKKCHRKTYKVRE